MPAKNRQRQRMIMPRKMKDLFDFKGYLQREVYLLKNREIKFNTIVKMTETKIELVNGK